MDDDRPDPGQADKTGPKKRGRGPGRPFVKGQSGNPAGMRRGSKHKLTTVVRTLATAEGEAIVRNIVEKAKAGDPNAQGLFLRYLLPQPKYVADPVELAPTASARQAIEQLGAVIAHTANGQLDLDSSRALIDALRTFVGCFQAVELESRLVNIEIGDYAPLEGEPAEELEP
jgi:hypothetical protein